MPSQRRVKVFGLTVLLVVLITMYYTSAARHTRTSDFYVKTTSALQEKADAAAVRAAEAAREQPHAENPDVGQRLKAAELAAKKAADKKGAEFEQGIMGEGSGERSVAGRLLMKDAEEKPLGVAQVGGRPDQQRERENKKPETKEEHEVEMELSAILKKSPSRSSPSYRPNGAALTLFSFAVIIFSKSYCPYSKKAKHILLDLYKIVPAPYVVELDLHPLGSALQAMLSEKTGRRTVPNVLINAVSVGGGDDIQALHEQGKLIETVTSMGGKKIVAATVVEQEEAAKEVRR